MPHELADRRHGDAAPFACDAEWSQLCSDPTVARLPRPGWARREPDRREPAPLRWPPASDGPAAADPVATWRRSVWRGSLRWSGGPSTSRPKPVVASGFYRPGGSSTVATGTCQSRLPAKPRRRSLAAGPPASQTRGPGSLNATAPQTGATRLPCPARREAPRCLRCPTAHPRPRTRRRAWPGRG